MKAVNLQAGQTCDTPMVIFKYNWFHCLFPDIQSANISYKLLSQLADCTPLGPALAPMKFPANIVQ